MPNRIMRLLRHKYHILFGKQLAQIQMDQYQNSTQKLLHIADIREGVVITKDGRSIKVLEVLPVNFELKSAIERQNIISYYASYLKIAPHGLQIKVLTQKADIDGYVNRLWAFHECEPVESCRTMIEDHINEVTYLAANEAATRRFFLIFQHEARMKTRGEAYRRLRSGCGRRGRLHADTSACAGWRCFVPVMRTASFWSCYIACSTNAPPAAPSRR